MLKKILIIALSRIKKTKNQSWAKDRMLICNRCPYNTKNLNKISFKQRISRFFSNILTLLMTGKLNADNSECSICTCTLTYKVISESEECEHPDGSKWESIYIPNSAQKEKWKK